MEFYAGALPEELERLKPEERRRVYGLLRLEVSARPDGALEARGILSERLEVAYENGHAVCGSKVASCRMHHATAWTQAHVVGAQHTCAYARTREERYAYTTLFLPQKCHPRPLHPNNRVGSTNLARR
jgi:hypothetical protein